MHSLKCGEFWNKLYKACHDALISYTLFSRNTNYYGFTLLISTLLFLPSNLSIQCIYMLFNSGFWVQPHAQHALIYCICILYMYVIYYKLPTIYVEYIYISSPSYCVLQIVRLYENHYKHLMSSVIVCVGMMAQILIAPHIFY